MGKIAAREDRKGEGWIKATGSLLKLIQEGGGTDSRILTLENEK